MHVFWMINIGSYAELLPKAFCIDFKLGKCLFHRKFNAKIIITPILFAFHFRIGFCRRRSKSRFFSLGDVIRKQGLSFGKSGPPFGKQSPALFGKPGPPFSGDSR